MLITEVRFFARQVSAITFFAQGWDYFLVRYILGRSAMTAIARTFGGLRISALPLVLFFAVASTVANAETRIGTAQSVKPEASGSIAGTLSAGSGVHASETVRTGSSGQAGPLLTTAISPLDLDHRSSSTSLFMIQIKGPEVLLLRPHAAHSGLLRARKTKLQLKSRRLPAPLAFAVEELIGRPEASA
jgi:hypothetical protein